MRIEEMRNLLRTQPFRPFTMHLPEGRTVAVVHHDFALLSPDGRTLVAYDANGAMNIIDVMLVSSVEIGPPPAAAPANGAPT